MCIPAGECGHIIMAFVQMQGMFMEKHIYQYKHIFYMGLFLNFKTHLMLD